MIRKALFYSIAFALAVLPLPAAALEVAGSFIQGGLVTGRAVPGTRLFLDGKAVPVSPTGDFMLGFGRDVPQRWSYRRSDPTAARPFIGSLSGNAVIKFSASTDSPGARLRLTPHDVARIRTESRLVAAAQEKTAATSLSAIRLCLAGKRPYQRGVWQPAGFKRQAEAAASWCGCGRAGRLTRNGDGRWTGRVYPSWDVL